jgi:hypothetical protein
MAIDFSARDGARVTQNESSMFAPTPLWERDARKRRRGGRPTARRQDPAIDAAEAGAGAGVMGATTATEPADTAYETQPANRGAARGGVAAGAVAAGVVVVAALGAVGWYASRAHDHGVAELTPGGPATSSAALATAAPPPTTMAQQSAAPTTPQSAAPAPLAAEPTRSPPPHASRSLTVRSTAEREPRVRPAPTDNASALSSGLNASTTAPMINTPPPAPSANPMQPTPSNPVVNPPNPATPPTTTAPPAGSVDDSAAPTASRAQDPSATP